MTRFRSVAITAEYQHEIAAELDDTIEPGISASLVSILDDDEIVLWRDLISAFRTVLWPGSYRSTWRSARGDSRARWRRQGDMMVQCITAHRRKHPNAGTIWFFTV